VGLSAPCSPMPGEMNLEAVGAVRCGDTDSVAGDAGHDRHEGAGETETHPPRRVEVDHNPRLPPPQTIGGGALGEKTRTQRS
jgi:hypothetical protein